MHGCVDAEYLSAFNNDTGYPLYRHNPKAIAAVRFLRHLYPQQQLISAIAVLFVPSVLFWSSGLLKDSLTFSFTLLSMISIYRLLIKPKNWMRYFFYLTVFRYQRQSMIL